MGAAIAHLPAVSKVCKLEVQLQRWKGYCMAIGRKWISVQSLEY